MYPEGIMSIHNLDNIFKPKGIVVIGASERSGTVGRSVVDNLILSGYKGDIFPVNPRYNRIRGFNAFGTVKQITAPVDLAIIVTPITTVRSLIKECAAKGIGGAVVISAGGKETGLAGKRIEAAIKGEAENCGLRIIGPNCAGIFSAAVNMNASFAQQAPMPGKLALVSQSGALCTAILDISHKEGIGFRYFISIGSMLDVDFGDLVNYLGQDSQVKSIVLYIENITNIRKFMSAARAVSRIKPIVVLKAGRSPAGAQAAASHTGAMAGADDVYQAAFKRAGIVQVDTIEELFDCAELMAKQPLPNGPGLAILTNGGGAGVMAADAASFHDIPPVALPAEAIQRLDTFLPSYWSQSNPIDIIGDATPERWQQAIDVCLSTREINGLVIIYIPQALTPAHTVALAVVNQLQKQPNFPVFAVWMGGESVEQARRILNKAGIPTYDTPERAVSAFKYMYTYSRNMEMLQEIPPKLPRDLGFDQSTAQTIVRRALDLGASLLTEVESKALLKAYGIPVNDTAVAASVDEAVDHAKAVGYPVVLKVYSKDITHKSDAGGVQLGLSDSDAVRSAYQNIMAAAETYNPNAVVSGVTVQNMLARKDHEIIVGCKQDRDFGPVLLFGMGGMITEIIRDRSIALPPLNRLLARRQMEGTKIFRLLNGYRNIPPANLELLEEILIRLAQLVTDFPEITELDINPLCLIGAGAVAVDARVVLEPAAVSAPHHLVISPYPNQFEREAQTKDGYPFIIRPIKPEDAPLMVDLFNSLSPRSIYNRFFTPLKRLSPKTLVLLTQIDYDRDMALVALDRSGHVERMLGVARLMSDPDVTRSEFAVLVADRWQGKGIGATLMKDLMLIAQGRRIKVIFGVILAENRQMLTLARKLGFDVHREPDTNQYDVQINLETVRST